MRIRKRRVPLPLSSLSPVPISSDPNFSRYSLVQLQQDQNPPGNLSLIADTASSVDDPQPSDHPIGGGGRSGEASSKVCLEEDERRKDVERRSNDSRKEDVVLSEEIESMVLKQPSCSHQAVGRWYEGEKAFPVKNGRGSLERRSKKEAITVNGKKMKTKMENKNKQPNGDKDQQQQQLEDHMKETKEDISFVNSTNIASGSSGTRGAKKRGRGGALMEGSRCSRVNGRGWRCFQQTLVGYSLCEHHLGKGRLRSMNNDRGRSKSTTTTSIAPKEEKSQPLSVHGSSLSLEEHELKPKVEDHVVDCGYEGEDHQEKQPLIVKKRKMKLGMVKARSLSSLLGLANEAISMAGNENK